MNCVNFTSENVEYINSSLSLITNVSRIYFEDNTPYTFLSANLSMIEFNTSNLKRLTIDNDGNVDFQGNNVSNITLISSLNASFGNASISTITSINGCYTTITATSVSMSDQVRAVNGSITKIQGTNVSFTNASLNKLNISTLEFRNSSGNINFISTSKTLTLSTSSVARLSVDSDGTFNYLASNVSNINQLTVTSNVSTNKLTATNVSISSGGVLQWVSTSFTEGIEFTMSSDDYLNINSGSWIHFNTPEALFSGSLQAYYFYSVKNVLEDLTVNNTISTSGIYADNGSVTMIKANTIFSNNGSFVSLSATNASIAKLTVTSISCTTASLTSLFSLNASFTNLSCTTASFQRTNIVNAVIASASISQIYNVSRITFNNYSPNTYISANSSRLEFCVDNAVFMYIHPDVAFAELNLIQNNITNAFYIFSYAVSCSALWANNASFVNLSSTNSCLINVTVTDLEFSNNPGCISLTSNACMLEFNTSSLKRLTIDNSGNVDFQGNSASNIALLTCTSGSISSLSCTNVCCTGQIRSVNASFQKVYINTSLSFPTGGAGINWSTAGYSKIFDDGDLNLYTDDNLYLQASTTTYIRSNSIVCQNALLSVSNVSCISASFVNVSTTNLTSTGTLYGKVIYAEVYSGAYSIQSGSHVTHNCSAISSYNPTGSNGYDTTKHCYFAPVAGVYSCTWNGRIHDGDTGCFIIRRCTSALAYTDIIADNDGREYWTQTDGSATTRKSYSISVIVKLTLGQGICLYNYYSDYTQYACHHTVTMLGTT
jgi:hypothetical protein